VRRLIAAAVSLRMRMCGGPARWDIRMALSVTARGNAEAGKRGLLPPASACPKSSS
jgi:hypothetical protein